MTGTILAVVVGAGMIAVALVVAASGLRRVVESRLGATDAEVRRVADATYLSDRGSGEVRREVSEVREALVRLRDRDEERRARETQMWETLHRVAGVLSGSQRTGRAGENVLDEALSHLPPTMLERGFRVNGRIVEFGLVLPDGRRLPVDSKWPAERELVALAEATDPADRERLIRAVEATVARRVREVAGYRNPAVTAPLAVAVVPDAAYAVLRRAHADAYRLGVIVIPYSMALPVLLFLHAIVGRMGEVVDVGACLQDVAAVLDAVELTLENKLEKASTMLSNGAGEIRGHVGKARSALTRAQAASEPSEGRLGRGEPAVRRRPSPEHGELRSAAGDPTDLLEDAPPRPGGSHRALMLAPP